MNQEELITALSDLNKTDLGLLISGLEEKWGIKAIKPAIVQETIAPPIETEEQTEWDVILESFPPEKKISIIKVIRELIGLSLTESKEIIENLPKQIRSQINTIDAHNIAGKLREAGATVTVK